MGRHGLWLATLCFVACEVESAGSGEACRRSSQCDPGLACVGGICSDDLSGLSEPGEVPDLTPEPEDAGQDGGGQADAEPEARPDPDRDAG